MSILTRTQYDEIVKYIDNYRGLSVDCELNLVREFPDVNKFSISSILSSHKNAELRTQFHKIQGRITKVLAELEKNMSVNKSPDVLINMSIRYQIAPAALSRLILYEKYKNRSKKEITELLRNPHLVPDEVLATNIRTANFSDNQEGPILDLVRRFLGEEYELKLKRMATDVGMSYYDEGDLRRTGYDKTPDLKLTVPCMYKGTVVHWIESKAVFGDVRSHRKHLREQLESYFNRFGTGIIIYWFGYLEEILHMKENGDNLIILNGFPDKSDLEFLSM